MHPPFFSCYFPLVSLANNKDKRMCRKEASLKRRYVEAGNLPSSGAPRSKSRLRYPPDISIAGLFAGMFLLSASAFIVTGLFHLHAFPITDFRGKKNVAVTGARGDFTCISDVQKAIPILNQAYGDSMHKVLYVGPGTCSVVSELMKGQGTEAWGVEPYNIADANPNCSSFVSKGFVRVEDIKFPLPYRAKSFSLVIVSDALDYLSPRYLNDTLPELARVAEDGLVIFTGKPYQKGVKFTEFRKLGKPAKGRRSDWWSRYFVERRFEGNEDAFEKFEKAASGRSYKPACQVFHLKPYQRYNFTL